MNFNISRFEEKLILYVPREKEIYEWRIKIVDAQIYGLVYDWYGLMEGEIGVVEGAI